MKRRIGFLRYVITAPGDFVALLVVLVVRLLWGSRLTLERGCVVVTLATGSWPTRTWYRGWGGTTFGHAIMLAPLDPWTRARMLEHELVHVEQFEGQALFALAYAIPIAVTWHPVAGIVAWAMSSWISVLAAGTIAVLRGESFYRGNAHEESAYAQTGEKRRIDAAPASIVPPKRPS